MLSSSLSLFSFLFLEITVNRLLQNYLLYWGTTNLDMGLQFPPFQSTNCLSKIQIQMYLHKHMFLVFLLKDKHCHVIWKDTSSRVKSSFDHFLHWAPPIQDTWWCLNFNPQNRAYCTSTATECSSQSCTHITRFTLIIYSYNSASIKSIFQQKPRIW